MIDAMVRLAVPPKYSEMARDTLKTFYQLCISASAGATTAAQVSVYHAKVALNATMDWQRTTFYPWACAVAQDVADWLRTACYPRACAVAGDIADIVSTIAMLLSKAVYRLLSLALLGARTSFRATVNWLGTVFYPWACAAAEDTAGWLETVVYPWACAAAQDIADIVTTNAVSLWEAAYRLSSAGLSEAFEFVRDLSGSVAMRATEVANATAASLEKFTAVILGLASDVFSTCPAGNTVEDAMMLMLGEAATAFPDAVGGFWACPAGKMVANVMMPMLGEVATGIFDAVGGFWACSAMETTRATVVLGDAATAFLDAVGGFWACSAGKMVTNVMMPMLGEVATGIFNTVGGFWACPAMEATRATVVRLVENGAATVVEVVFHLWTAAVERGTDLVKTHLLEDKLALVVMVLLVVRAACQSYKMRTMKACARALGGGELAKEVGSTRRQASDLKLRYTDRSRKRRSQQKGLRRLKDKVIEATARRYLEAEKADRIKEGCQLLARSLSHAKTNTLSVRGARWKTELAGLEKKVVGVDAGGSGMGGGAASDTGDAAKGNGGSGASDGVVAPSSGTPAQGSGCAGEGRRNTTQGIESAREGNGNAEPRRPNLGSWWAMLDDGTPAQGNGGAREGEGNAEPRRPSSWRTMLD